VTPDAHAAEKIPLAGVRQRDEILKGPLGDPERDRACRESGTNRNGTA
jgi:hypothetical protein